MILSPVKLYVLLLLSGAFVSSQVTVENGGYRLLVSFSQNIPFEDGQKLIESLKTTLVNTSNVLRQAIGIQFSKVILKIPQSWNVSGWEISVGDISGQERTDILVDNTNDTVFGKLPYANQYGGCYMPGRQIVIPTAFFDDSNEFPKEISLAREWLKYRYGVFDENGFFGDPLYPLFYNVPGSDPNDVKITDCTNEEVTYNFTEKTNNEDCSTADKSLIQKLKSGECTVVADEEGLASVVSSLMYFHEEIHSMKYVCGKDSHNHNSNAPNKQNALCYGRSIWDIVNSSSEIRSEDISKEPIGIDYTYVKETMPKVVVAWENTAQLKTKETVILNALYKFIIDLPLGSQLSTMSFTDDIDDIDDIGLQTLNEIDKKKKLITDLSSDFVSNENANMNLALQKAIDILSSSTTDGPQPEGSILIITKTIETPEESLLGALKENQNVYVRILFFSESGIPEKIKKSVSEMKNMEIKEISMSSENQVAFAKLLETMEEILPSTVDNKETIKERVQYLSKGKPIDLNINGLAETITFWVFSKKQSNNFNLTLNGVKKGKDEIISENFGGSILKMSCSLNQEGKIKFDYPHDSEPMLTEVEITSKAGKYFSGEVFIHDTSEKNSEVQMPVIMYARIRFGPAYPVQNLKVTVKILKPDGKTREVEMYDDGKGDPDITKNDGIYSRYFTDFSGKGKYSVTVIVQNRGDSSTLGADENAGYQTCCGSEVKEGTSKLGAFSREFKTTFIARGRKPDGGYNPSRIADLRIKDVTNENIILTWSAPGGEADYGRASKYEIKLFSDEEIVTENIHKMIRILNKPPPMNYGAAQQVAIQVLNKTQALSMGIVAHNENNKKSDLSNIVEIFRPSETPEIQTTPPIVTDPEATNQVKALVGPIIGGILILICIVLAIIYYFKGKLHKEKPVEYNGAQNIKKDNIEIKPTFKAADLTIKTEPVKRIESFPVLLYTHNQIKDYKETGKEPPLYKSNVPVKQWKSLDVISNLRQETEKETKSLGSASTVHPTDSTETNETA